MMTSNRREANAPPVCIHLGMPKTASTMLQTHLFTHHPGVIYLGKFPARKPIVYETEPVRRFVSYIRCETKSISDSELAVVKSYRESAQRENKPLVISCEGFIGGPAEKNRLRAERLRETFPNVRVLLVVREPFEFLESFYFQQLKGYNRKNAVYGTLRSEFGEPPVYFDINRWLDAKWDRLIENEVHYADKAQQYVDVLGRDCVKLMSFDRLRSNTRDFIDELSDWIGIDSEVSYELCANKRSNDRVTEFHIDRLKQLAGSFWLRWMFRRCRTGDEREALLRLAPDSVTPKSPKARAVLSEQWRSIVAAAASPQLEALKADWGISFERGDHAESTRPLSPSSSESPAPKRKAA